MHTHNIKDTQLKKGKGLLSVAKDVVRYYVDTTRIRPIKDKYGKIGFELDNHYLVAKRNMFGDIVSVDVSIWNRARKNNKKILIFMGDSKYFYEFDPKEITDTVTNSRGDKMMVNFSIRNGVNMAKRKAEDDFQHARQRCDL